MLIRSALALLLLLPAAATATAQDLDVVVSALVRIAGTRGGTPVRGTGFVVGVDRDQATIATAAHVIEGVQQLEVTFAVDPTRSLPAGVVLGMDAGSPNGLAAFLVRGPLPAEVTTLSFEVENRPRPGAALFLLGFPQMELAPRATQRVLSGRRGTLLLVDQGIGEGFSGGPVLKGGRVVGVVTDTDDQTTYAVNALVAREALEGWGVNLSGASSATQARPAPPIVEKCVPGEEQIENSIAFVRLCPATFTMGSAQNDSQASAEEMPTHRVTLSEFWIGRTEVTNEQYRRFRSEHLGEDRLPVTNVSWHEAKAACEHFGGRLPTEAEWEYAARAGSQSAWSFGNDEKKLGEFAWYRENSGNKPHPVGMKNANAWGLQDLHGNVGEWLADWYGTYSSAAQLDPPGPATGDYRVVRGGTFEDSARFLRSARRDWINATIRIGYVGFRCARDPRRQP